MKYRPFFFGFATLLLSSAASAQLAAPAQSSGIFTGKDAEGVIESAIARQDGASDIKVSINEIRDTDIITQSTGPLTADAESVSVDKAHNRWEATLVLQQNGQNFAPIRLTGRYEEMAQVPVLRRRVMPGEVISQDDIEWDKEAASRLRKTTITDPQDMIGKSPKHPLSQGRAVRLDEIARPAIVNKGAQVTLMFRSNTIEIRTYGEAMEPGAKGDVIRVRNTTSKNVVQGIVASENEVRVSTPESSSAEVVP